MHFKGSSVYWSVGYVLYWQGTYLRYCPKVLKPTTKCPLPSVPLWCSTLQGSVGHPSLSWYPQFLQCNIILMSTICLSKLFVLIFALCVAIEKVSKLMRCPDFRGEIIIQWDKPKHPDYMQLYNAGFHLGGQLPPPLGLKY